MIVTSSSLTEQIALGAAVPPYTAHAISVSLPTWQDNVGYEEGEKRVVDAMVSGYPRFFINLKIQKLEKILEQKFAFKDERCMLFPTRTIADACRSFILDRTLVTKPAAPSPSVRLVQFSFSPDGPSSSPPLELHIVLFPPDIFPVAKEFWQHTGLGISSRLAERCLGLLPDHEHPANDTSSPTSANTSTRIPTKAARSNRHYSKRSISSPSSPTFEPDPFTADQSTYLEERYGRNLPPTAGPSAKRALRRRIAGVLLRDTPFDWADAGQQDTEVGPSSRGVSEVSEEDVFLYPTGMAAIWSAHQIALGALHAAKSVCFGFPYTDTLKILQKWGPGCHFLGNGLDADIDSLEQILESASSEAPSTPPILALFTEFPSNPLLRCADLHRLRALADKYDFLVVVDDTIGNFVNVEVLPYADIVVSSLSKIFSGDANVMGGSLVLNPKGRHYAALKAHLSRTYEDAYFNEDAIYMERNSRDFRRRIATIDTNTEAVCDLLHSHSLAASPASSLTPPVVKQVYYPKYTTARQYAGCRVPGGGYGGLFSVTFTSDKASHAFFDTLPFPKGPSLGTNFTLACPYTILGHYLELEWAAGYGVEAGLVRVSVGMEEREVLLKGFGEALKAAEEAAKTELV